MTTKANLLDIKPRELVEDEPLTSSTSEYVCIPQVPADPTPEQTMRIVETSGALDFWEREQEDIYTTEDGEPV